MTAVDTYLALVAAVVANASPENIDAVEAFEAANPGIEDDAYRAAGPMTYEVVSGTVYGSLDPLI